LHNIGHHKIKRDPNAQTDMPTIVHFQIPSDDIERSKKFYNDLFGWKFDKFPSSPSSEPMPEGMEYWMISTVEQQRITNYFEVKSVQEYSAKVEQLGGKVISTKMPVKSMVYFGVCTDTENNGFGIFEADQTAK